MIEATIILPRLLTLSLSNRYDHLIIPPGADIE
jgi:hypothetical protein